MKTNSSSSRTKLFSIIIYVSMGLLVLALGVIFRQALAPKEVKGQAPSESISQSLPAPKITTFSLTENSGISQNPANQPATQTQFVNDIEMTVWNFTLVGDRLSLDSCYTLPDTSAWIANLSTVEFNGNVVHYSESIPIELRLKKSAEEFQVFSFDGVGGRQIHIENAKPEDKGKRCDRFIFIVGPDVKGPFTFSFGSIIALPREGETCTLANIEKLQMVMDKKKSQVKIGCDSANNRATSGGSEGVIIKEKPQTMSEAEANSLLDSGITETYGVTGPWIFHWDPAQ